MNIYYKKTQIYKLSIRYIPYIQHYRERKTQDVHDKHYLCKFRTHSSRST